MPFALFVLLVPFALFALLVVFVLVDDAQAVSKSAAASANEEAKALSSVLVLGTVFLLTDAL